MKQQTQQFKTHLLLSTIALTTTLALTACGGGGGGGGGSSSTPSAGGTGNGGDDTTSPLELTTKIEHNQIFIDKDFHYTYQPYQNGFTIKIEPQTDQGIENCYSQWQIYQNNQNDFVASLNVATDKTTYDNDENYNAYISDGNTLLCDRKYNNATITVIKDRFTNLDMTDYTLKIPPKQNTTRVVNFNITEATDYFTRKTQDEQDPKLIDYLKFDDDYISTLIGQTGMATALLSLGQKSSNAPKTALKDGTLSPVATIITTYESGWILEYTKDSFRTDRLGKWDIENDNNCDITQAIDLLNETDDTHCKLFLTEGFNIDDTRHLINIADNLTEFLQNQEYYHGFIFEEYPVALDADRFSRKIAILSHTFEDANIQTGSINSIYHTKYKLLTTATYQ
ncbi:MAG: hypothetical protein DRQ51_04720 [Gammaproteobacteria bacterium]|nr:MAG: hypothetical protein DRQ51_04720 [Gammaproteobacteria bacterium]